MAQEVGIKDNKIKFPKTGHFVYVSVITECEIQGLNLIEGSISDTQAFETSYKKFLDDYKQGKHLKFQQDFADEANPEEKRNKAKKLVSLEKMHISDARAFEENEPEWMEYVPCLKRTEFVSSFHIDGEPSFDPDYSSLKQYDNPHYTKCVLNGIKCCGLALAVNTALYYTSTLKYARYPIAFLASISIVGWGYIDHKDLFEEHEVKVKPEREKIESIAKLKSDKEEHIKSFFYQGNETEVILRKLWARDTDGAIRKMYTPTNSERVIDYEEEKGL